MADVAKEQEAPVGAEAQVTEINIAEEKTEVVEDAEMKDEAEGADTKANETMVDASNVDKPQVDELKSNDTQAKANNTKTSANAGKSMLKTTRKHGNAKIQNNVKFDPSVLPPSDDPREICSQAEFYFGDSNLPTDEYMWNLTGGSENKAFSLKTLCDFKRMRRFQPYSAVVAALKEHSKLLLIEGEEGEEVVKRKKAYKPSPEYYKTRTARSVYVKGFGDEQPNTQFTLEAFFQKFGDVEAVRLRRTEEKLFKGSVFVEFQTIEAAEKFLSIDPKPTWEGHELLIMSKQAYCDDKVKLIQEGKIKPSGTGPGFFEGRNRRDDRGGRGGRGGFTNRDDWKKRRDHDQKHNNHKNGNNRGRGRGNNRGGRGRGNNNHRDRNGRDGREKEAAPVDVSAMAVAEADKAATAVKAEDAAPQGTKRAREDETKDATEPAAKKLDTKAGDAAHDKDGAAKSTKRAREDDTTNVAEPPAKKLDSKTEVAAES